MERFFAFFFLYNIIFAGWYLSDTRIGKFLVGAVRGLNARFKFDFYFDHSVITRRKWYIMEMWIICICVAGNSNATRLARQSESR